MLCIFPFTGGFIGIFGMIIIPFYCILACIYNRKVIKNTSTFRKIFTSYSLMVGYLFLAFNLMLYSIPKSMKLNISKFIILIIVFEIACMIFGCIYAYLSIKKNKIKGYKEESALSTSIIVTLCGCWTIFLRRYVSTKPIEIRAFILLITFAICCCIISFYIGKIFIPMLYFIKKFNINEFNFTDEKEHK